MSIVVTAATGHLGTLVIDELLQRVPADEVVAVVRNAAKAAPIADRGVEVRVADYNDPDALAKAFGADDTVLLISGLDPNRLEQHQAVITAAMNAGVARIAYTSVLGGPDADFELAADHIATEQAILDSGLPYTFLRNGWYSEVYTDQIAVQLVNGVVGSAGDGRIASAARRDYAAAAAVVLTGEGHEKKAYELNGDTTWTLTDYAAELSKQSGQNVAYNNLSPEDLTQVLTAAGIPAPFVPVLVGVDDAIKRGLLAGRGSDLSRLIGRPTTPIADTIAAALNA
ncbi:MULTISPECIES: SDR family oxidoreductase [Kribbella]|uniref:NAD(P)H dehydrogenase (Quinone) n=1 Tax=Kribbella pratensis TaxID=2512112 RepID=A0ABY2FQF9_9ACTN|nr:MULTISPECIES: SDR family oxidoreductase [Kribbella]TDW94810.1 NAD(P)H dehydrogenase (quinone) [Kribbella pratensis]TDX03405.1 NAD(P)H dehydrogenase (quinone) [Kribbella sp. VKM Ac-2566]